MAWSTANLSVARGSLSATSVGTKVFFAGGWDSTYNASSMVDIYDNSSNTWSTANLSVARGLLSATSVGTKAFFAGGCDTSSACFSVIDIYDIKSARINENMLSANEIKIYPNPTKDNLTIETNSTKEQKLEILNLIGQTVYTSVITKKAVVKTSEFPVGVYFIKLSTDKETVVKKFVKE